MGKRQIIFIHGGNAFSEYDAFLEYLRTCPIEDPLGLETKKKWQPTIREELIDTHEVYYPSMPNSKNAKYQEWRIWFERYVDFLRDGAILIGHSQGGYFLAKYLTENTMSKRVEALYLLAAPFEPDNFGGEDGGDFSFDTTKLPRLAEQVGSTYIFHSKDDPVVPYAHALKYAEALPQAELVIFNDKNHFLLESFPEFIEHLAQRT